MGLSGKARIAGVIGWPVEHSLSPKLHNYWLSENGIDGAYIPLAVRPEDLGEVLRSLPKMGLRGVNLTIPHKEQALSFLDQIDDTARTIGAVNTIIIKDGKLHGTNTDAYGFAENIKPHLTGKRKAVVLGAGGASKAVCYALAQLGFAQIIICNRTQSKAEQVADAIPSATVAAWDRRAQSLEAADILVNTTSLGLSGKEPLDIDLSALPASALVTDIVYHPLITPLLEQAQQRGNPVVDGLGMLLHQAVPGFSAWFGVTPQVTPALRRMLLNA